MVALYIVLAVAFVLLAYVIGRFVWKQEGQRAIRQRQQLLEQAETRLPELPWYEAHWQVKYLADALQITQSEAAAIVDYFIGQGWVRRTRWLLELFYVTTEAGSTHFGRPLQPDAAFYELDQR